VKTGSRAADARVQLRSAALAQRGTPQLQRRTQSLALIIASILAASAAAEPDAASGALDEVIVTAQKRAESLQTVPVSVETLDNHRLEELRIASFDQYIRYLPSLSAQSFGPGQSELTVRGVTNGTVGLRVGSQPLVGVYLDELPETTIGNNLDMHIYDVARVEALSGPQGTLYGSS
jgi:outer membrane receptor protein involved in Fe transport